MRYFVGFVLEGEAAEWHNALAREISEKFNTWCLPDRLPPHITVYYFPDAPDMAQVKTLLTEWASKQEPITFEMKDFDHFGERSIFATAEPSETSYRIIENLRTEIRKLPRVEDDGNSPWHPHASLARDLDSSESRAVWEYLSMLPKPNFTLSFNKLVLYRLDGKKYIAEEAFPFSK